MQRTASSPRVAPPRSVEQLILRYQEDGDRAARDQAVTELMPLVYSLCRRYEHGNVEWDDLVSIASFGLVKAIERFDPARGLAISTFAVPTIAGEIKRYHRDRSWAIRPPRDLQERALLVKKAVTKLTTEHGRSPVPAVVAEHLGLAEEDVVEALVASRGYSADSLDAPAAGDSDGGTVAEQHGREDIELDRAGERVFLAGLVAVLPEREQEILRLRFEEDLTQREIGDRIGVSQMQISRLLRTSLARLRAASTATPE